MSARLAVGLGLALAACGAPDGDAPTVDSVFVSALVELHLADARATVDTMTTVPEGHAAFADSLRREALAQHGLDSASLSLRLDALAADPALTEATYDAVDSRLALERQGVTPASEASRAEN